MEIPHSEDGQQMGFCDLKRAGIVPQQTDIRLRLFRVISET